MKTKIQIEVTLFHDEPLTETEYDQVAGALTYGLETSPVSVGAGWSVGDIIWETQGSRIVNEQG